MRATIDHAGQEFELFCANCTLHGQGEFAGNIDLVVGATPKLSIDAIVERLGLKAVGVPQTLQVVGSAETPQGAELTFYSRQLEGMTAPPAGVEVHWRADDGMDSNLGRVTCEMGD